jgi:UDP-2-acetamido-2,6-beta-L-arabino-hexul-4-ose reductase
VIIGNGNIAKILPDSDEIIFFASGVSDSSCTDENKYMRELALLSNLDRSRHLVYFSNLGVYYKHDRYTSHKIAMEDFIRNHFNSYTIVRMEVCEWVNNPTTILNVFKRKLANGEHISVRDEYRYVVSLEEFLYWIKMIKPNTRGDMNILGNKYKVSEIVELIKQGKL